MKDILKRVTNDKRKYIIICACAVLVIALITVLVIAAQLKRNKNNIVDNTIAETKPIQENTSQKITEQDSTEETTEEHEDVVVEEKAVEEFFEKEIATEDEEALELPSRHLTAEFVPYDGLHRNISCYGDSMVAGVGCETEGTVNGKNIYGWTSPGTLERLTGITTYNLGVPGETSYQITFRAGGIKVYTDREITISEDQSATAQLIDEYGNVLVQENYSGYPWYDDPNPGSMFINGYLCDVENADNDEVTIKLTKGYAAYNSNNYTSAVVYSGEKETIANNNFPTNSTEKSTETSTSEKPTESVTEAPTQGVVKEAVTIAAGTQAYTRASQERSANDILVLEIGSNGGWYDYQELILQYDNIIINSGCQYYIIVGDTDNPGSSPADDNQGEYNNDGSYIGIGDTAWEAALREAYGEHFFNTRTYMIQYGLSDCGLDTTTDDLENFKKGNISEQLRYDWTHFNSYGYYAKGTGIYKKGVELGYWS